MIKAHSASIGVLLAGAGAKNENGFLPKHVD